MKLEIIKTEKGLVAASDEMPKQGQYCVDGDEIFGPYEQTDIAISSFKPIILTDTSFELEGVMQFELEKSKIKELTWDECKDIIANNLMYSSVDRLNLKYNGWYEWVRYTYPSNKDVDEAYKKVGEIYSDYKTAQSKYKYTEEDLIEAFKAGVEYQETKNQGIGRTYSSDEYIQHLNQPKQLKYIEVDSLEATNGVITVKKYIYDNECA